LTTVEPDEQGKTARIEQQPAPSASPSPSSAPPPATPPSDEPETPEAEPAPVEAPRAEEPLAGVIEPVAGVVIQSTVRQPDVVFVPLAVNVGDGFKFGCGFFLAMVLAMLIGFVLLAALFVLTSLFGLNLPISR
jgi:hypothetical protein